MDKILSNNDPNKLNSSFHQYSITPNLIDTLRNNDTDQLFIIIHPLIDQKKNLFDFFYDLKHFVLSLKWVSHSNKHLNLQNLL